MQQAPAPEVQAATDCVLRNFAVKEELNCQFCRWPLIKDGELECFRSGHTVKATLGEKKIFCPFCRKPKVTLAKNNRAICPKCEKGKKEGTLMVEEKEREIVKDLVSLCRRTLVNVNKKIEALKSLPGGCYIDYRVFNDYDDYRYGYSYSYSYSYREVIDTSFLNHRWEVGLKSWDRGLEFVFRRTTGRPDVIFFIDLSKEEDRELEHALADLRESGEVLEELIYQLVQGSRRAVARFDEKFRKIIEMRSSVIAKEVVEEKLKTLGPNV